MIERACLNILCISKYTSLTRRTQTKLAHVRIADQLFFPKYKTPKMVITHAEETSIAKIGVENLRAHSFGINPK